MLELRYDILTHNKSLKPFNFSMKFGVWMNSFWLRMHDERQGIFPSIAYSLYWWLNQSISYSTVSNGILQRKLMILISIDKSDLASDSLDLVNDYENRNQLQMRILDEKSFAKYDRQMKEKRNTLSKFIIALDSLRCTNVHLVNVHIAFNCSVVLNFGNYVMP